jgi:GT2 family glycosyltransferase
LITSNYELILVTQGVQTGACNELLSSMLESQPNLTNAMLLLLDETVDLGPAHDRNIGAQFATSTNILFADDDTAFLEDIAGLLEYLNENKCAGLQPLLIRSQKTQIVDSAGDFIWKSGPTYRPYSRCFEQALKKIEDDLFVEEVPSLKGAFMLLKKEAFFTVGGFDSSFNFNFEDVDLGWRLTTSGFKLLFVPTVKAQHNGGRVSAGYAKQSKSVIKLGLLNFYTSQFKLNRRSRWLALFGCFEFEFFLHLTMNRTCFEIRKSIKDIVMLNALLIGRLFSIRAKKSHYSFNGLRRFEDMAHGKRFIYKKEL